MVAWLPILAAASLIGGGIKKNKQGKQAQKNVAQQQADMQKQAAFDAAEAAKRTADQNAVNAKNEKSRTGRFNMGISILRSLGGVVPPEVLDQLEASNGQFNPIVQQAPGMAPVPTLAKPEGYGFLDFGLDAVNEVGGYLAQKKAAEKAYGGGDGGEDEDYLGDFGFGDRATGDVNRPANGGTPFGSQVNFAKGRPALHQKYRF